MILSMTGYGKGKATYEDKSILIEIKSLNGKTSDVRTRIPNNYKSQEIKIRQMVMDSAYRGKFDFLLEIESADGNSEFSINKAAFKKYYRELSELKENLDISDETDFIQSILRIPNVIGSKTEEVAHEEWKAVQSAIKEALSNLHDFRAQEGKVMYDDLSSRVANIQKYLLEITPFEEERITNLRERFKRNLEEFISNDNLDRNRYEQEIIYYLEKLDINEEKVRLDQHCNYFNEVLESKDIEVGKKMNFIAQEMGREINTLGAKAQEKNIQHRVVSMKDELEKLKEQLANIV